MVALHFLKGAAAMKVTQLSPHIGAEVTGIDLRNPTDAESRRRLNAAVVDNVALVIRDQDFTPQQYLAAVALFGEPMEQHFTQYALPGCPLVHEVSNQHTDKSGKRVKHGAGWHTDHTNHVRPPKYTSLYAVALPPSAHPTTPFVAARENPGASMRSRCRLRAGTRQWSTCAPATRRCRRR